MDIKVVATTTTRSTSSPVPASQLVGDQAVDADVRCQGLAERGRAMERRSEPSARSARSDAEAPNGGDRRSDRQTMRSARARSPPTRDARPGAGAGAGAARADRRGDVARAVRPHDRGHRRDLGRADRLRRRHRRRCSPATRSISPTPTTSTNTQHRSRSCGSTIRARCRCPTARRTDPNDKVVGIDFSGGLASVVAPDQRALGSTGLQFSNPSGTTLRVLDDGAAGQVDVDALSATTTIDVARPAAAPELPFFLDGSKPYTGAITARRRAERRLCRAHRRQPALLADPSRLVVYQTSPLTPAATPRGRISSRPARPTRILRFLAAGRRRHRGGAVQRLAAVLHAADDQPAGRGGGDGRQPEAGPGRRGQFAAAALQRRVSVNIDQEMANLLKLQNRLRRERARAVGGQRHDRQLLQDVRPHERSPAIGAQSSLVVQSLGDMRTQLDDLQRQLGTGKKSDTYAGLGLDRGLAVGLRAQLSALDGLRRPITKVGVRLELAQTALGAHRRSSRTTSKASTLQSAIRIDAAARPATQRAPIRSSTRSSACSTRRPATATCSPAAPATSRRPRRIDHILNGDGARAGLKQIIAERKQADLGASGLGRLLIPAAAGDVGAHRGRDAVSPFGFKLAGVTSTLNGATVTADRLAAGHHGRLRRRQSERRRHHHTSASPCPTARRESLTLTATTSATRGRRVHHRRDSDATAANLQAALTAAVGKLAATSLSAASAMAAATISSMSTPASAAARRRPAVRHRDRADRRHPANTVTWYTGEMRHRSGARAPRRRAGRLLALGLLRRARQRAGASAATDRRTSPCSPP